MTKQASFPLFVYGSLLSGFKSPAYDYITQFFDLAGKARVRGLLFDMGEYPAAVPVPDENFIEGELYTIKHESEFSWAITQLDDYEGVLVEAGQPPLYRRELAEIFFGEEKVTAWIYWFNGDVTGKPFIDSGNLLDYIARMKGLE